MTQKELKTRSELLQDVASLIRDDIQTPIRFLQEESHTESARILILVRMDNLANLVDMKMTHAIGEFWEGIDDITPKEIKQDRNDLLHSGGMRNNPHKSTATRQLIIRESAAPIKITSPKGSVNVDETEFVLAFGRYCRNIYQHICSERVDLELVRERLESMYALRNTYFDDESGNRYGIGRAYGNKVLSHDEWREFHDLGTHHVVRRTFYLYNRVTCTHDDDDKMRIKEMLIHNPKFSISKSVLPLTHIDGQGSAIGIYWQQDITDTDISIDELLELSGKEFDDWYTEDSGAENCYCVGGVGDIEVIWCQHGKDRYRGTRLWPFKCS